MRILITGANGFLGRYFVEECRTHECEVVTCCLEEGAGDISLDVTDAGRVHKVMCSVQPDVVVNFAGEANLTNPWKDPQRSIVLNTIAPLNMLEAVRRSGMHTRVVLVGSSYEYGTIERDPTNIREETPFRPSNPYAISKVAQSYFVDAYWRTFGVDACVMRCFNLAGPRQTKGFIVADFASGVAEVEAGKADYVKVGNLQSARDFTHVRDAARACWLIARHGKPGEAYHVCSGKSYTAQYLLDSMIALARTPVAVCCDKSRLRAGDVPVLCGNHDKLTRDTGWEPLFGIEDIVTDTLEYWRGMVASND